MLVREEGKGGIDNSISIYPKSPFESSSSKFPMAYLLVFHWPELSHVTMPRCRRAGKYSLFFTGYMSMWNKTRVLSLRNNQRNSDLPQVLGLEVRKALHVFSR